MRQGLVLTAREKRQQALRFVSMLLIITTFFFLPIKPNLTHYTMTLALMLLLLGRGWRRELPVILQNPLTRPALIFTGICLLSMTYSSASWPWQFYDFEKYSKILYIPLLLPLFRQHLVRQFAIMAYLAITAFVLLLSYLKFFGFIHFGVQLSPNSLFVDHINTSIMFAFAALICCYRSVYTFYNRHLYRLYTVALVTQLIFLNTSRTGMAVSLSLAIFSVCKLFPRKKILIAISMLLALLGLCYYLPTHLHTLVNTTFHNILNGWESNALTSSSLRMEFYRNSWELIKQAPLLGHGIGSFVPSYYQQFPDAITVKAHLMHPHNEYLLLLTELGLLGLVSFCYVLFQLYRTSKNLNPEYQFLMQGLIISVTVGSLFHCLYYRSTLGFFFILFATLFASNYKDVYGNNVT